METEVGGGDGMDVGSRRRPEGKEGIYSLTWAGETVLSTNSYATVYSKRIFGRDNGIHNGIE